MKMFGLNISLKSSLIIQGILVFSLVPMDIFLGEIRLDYIIPLYTLIWIMTYRAYCAPNCQQ
mgnify:CR=1 FL=1